MLKKLLKTIGVTILAIVLSLCFAVTKFLPIIIILFAINWICWIWNCDCDYNEKNH